MIYILEAKRYIFGHVRLTATAKQLQFQIKFLFSNNLFCLFFWAAQIFAVKNNKNNDNDNNNDGVDSEGQETNCDNNQQTTTNNNIWHFLV